jgi:endo-1,3(4)-beta-glucanase
VWSYTADELADPTIGDEWCALASLFVCPSDWLTLCSTRKCVIIAAYSNYNPQVAAAWSANITDWGLPPSLALIREFELTQKSGTGNTYTNELFFIGTGANPNGTPICSALPQNPYGNFKIQVASSGNYVVASSSSTNLVASTTSSSAAAIFNSSYIPNAGTLQLTSTSQYVTADSSGSYALAAIRATASTWERFVVRQKLGASSGVYSMGCT